MDNEVITWEEFGEEVKKILTPEQVEKIKALHDRVPVSYSGCAAQNEGTPCCVQAAWI